LHIPSKQLSNRLTKWLNKTGVKEKQLTLDVYNNNNLKYKYMLTQKYDLSTFWTNYIPIKCL